jgi:hypothetical protein
MTEHEWLHCTNPAALLMHVRTVGNERKLRLFGCGCGRSVWEMFIDQRSREAIEVSERFADGNAAESELDAAISVSSHASDELENNCLSSLPKEELQLAERYWNAAELAWKAAVGTFEIFETAQIALGFSVNVITIIRCVFGNPFRPVIFDRRWLTSTVVNLATAIYAERAFDRMPILADALQDAGCDDAEILTHCQGETVHVKGCWALDLFLAKS